MTYTAGQPVRIVARCAHHEETATIAAVVPGQDHPYRIDTLAPWPLWFGDGELVPVREALEAA